jgi:hypothetical protein
MSSKHSNLSRIPRDYLGPSSNQIEEFKQQASAKTIFTSQIHPTCLSKSEEMLLLIIKYGTNLCMAELRIADQ